MATYVLVPGSGGVAWYWHRVAPLLRQARHEVIAVDLPGDDHTAGLPEYARLVVEAIGGRSDAVLVAQSLGGFTAPLVAGVVPVRALVFVNAMIPAHGETPGEWWYNTGSEAARVAAAGQNGYSVDLDEEIYFLHDVAPDVLASGPQGPQRESAAVFASTCDFDAWPSIPIRVVAGADDRFFPAEFQRTVARDRLGIEADVLPGGHLIALSQPAKLADYLLAI